MNRPSRSGRWVVVFLVGSVCVALRSGEAVAQEKSPGKLEAAIKRRTPTTEEDLRKLLRSAPEVGFDQQAASELYVPILKAMKGTPQLKHLPEDLGLTTLHDRALQSDRLDMVFLPWITGADNELIKEDAERLNAGSTKLRLALLKSVKRGDERPDPEKLQPLLAGQEWTTPAAVPVITQVMQAESTAVRLLLVDMLAKIGGPDASIALAKRAIFDLSPEVRAKAVRALAARPAYEYTPTLYYGFRYPWPAAADHAAEAVAALNRIDLVPGLVKLLKEPNPNLPVKTDQGYTVQEVVRINHLSNCVLCHAPSLEKGDLVRGRVPIPGEKPPPSYYQEKSGFFVRANLTYLRQDFSVVQPVANPDMWAGNQRYDYLVRTRPLSAPEQAAFQKLEKEDRVPKSYPQQEAVAYALRELTGQDHGTTYESWSTGLRNAPRGTRGAEKPNPQPEKP
jgi:hypothetical protein